MPIEKSEQQVLDSSLERALAEAAAKTGKAVESVNEKGGNYEKRVWAAAEASEYLSLIFCLTYNLETESSRVSSPKKNEEPMKLVRDAQDAINRAQTLRHQGNKNSILEAYGALRQATDNLRTTYLALTRVKTHD